MIADASANNIGNVALGLIALGQLYLIVDKIVSGRANKSDKKNGRGWVTKAEFEKLVTRIDAASSRFDVFVAERRRDMDMLMSGSSVVSRPTKWKVLLVEDEDTDRMIFRRKMSNQLEIDDVRTLTQAFQKLAENDYDCVILDLALPDVFGEETLRRFKEKCDSAACIIMTGNTDPNMAQKAGELGFEATIFKDREFDEQEVIRKVSAAILRHR